MGWIGLKAMHPFEKPKIKKNVNIMAEMKVKTMDSYISKLFLLCDIAGISGVRYF